MTEKNYNETYYKSGCGEDYGNKDVWMNNFDYIADKLIENYEFDTILDCGCAWGYLVTALRNKGKKAYGIDISKYAISKVDERYKNYFSAQSVLADFPDNFPKKFDVIISIEMIEHLFEDDGLACIKKLCEYSDVILLTSSPDDIKEKTHYNVQQPEYWVKHFAKNGFYNNYENKPSFITENSFYFYKTNKFDRVVENYEHSLRLSKYKREDIIENQKLENENNEIKINKLNEVIKQTEKNYETIIKDNKILFNAKYEKLIEDNESLIIKYEKEKEKLNNHILECSKVIDTLNNEKAVLNYYHVRHDMILKSLSWKITSPLRLVGRIILKIYNILFKNRLFFLIGEARKYRKIHGLKETIKHSFRVLSGKNKIVSQHPSVISFKEEKKSFTRTGSPNDAIDILAIDSDVKRLNLVTDTLDASSLLGGVSTALVIASKCAYENDLELRIITRNTDYNAYNYKKNMELLGIKIPNKLSFYSDYMGNNNFKLDVSKNDIFIATSWWSADAISKTTIRKRFFYIIQEVETMFYNYGDDHHKCNKILNNDNIDFIINSSYLNEYFKNDETTIVKNGIYFEPAFPKSLYSKSKSDKKGKKKLFFYSRPNNPRNLFTTGVEILEEAIKSSIINTNDWDIYFVGQDTPNIIFSNGYKVKNIGQLSWSDYAEFISTVDIGLCLMYTPHPSYPPFDIASSGGVVLTNKFMNKKEFPLCENVIMADLDIMSMLKGLQDAVDLALNDSLRTMNYKNSKIYNDWNNTLDSTMKYMRDKL